jgi:hypothetical protein
MEMPNTQSELNEAARRAATEFVRDLIPESKPGDIDIFAEAFARGLRAYREPAPRD